VRSLAPVLADAMPASQLVARGQGRPGAGISLLPALRIDSERCVSQQQRLVARNVFRHTRLSPVSRYWWRRWCW